MGGAGSPGEWGGLWTKATPPGWMGKGFFTRAHLWSTPQIHDCVSKESSILANCDILLAPVK